jgi:hypothetical protein
MSLCHPYNFCGLLSNFMEIGLLHSERWTEMRIKDFLFQSHLKESKYIMNLYSIIPQKLNSVFSQHLRE